MEVAVDPTSVGVKQRETQRRICLKDHEPRWLTNGLLRGTQHRNTSSASGVGADKRLLLIFGWWYQSVMQPAVRI